VWVDSSAISWTITYSSRSFGFFTISVFTPSFGSHTRLVLDLAKRVFPHSCGRRDGLGRHCPFGQSPNAFEVFRRPSAVRRGDGGLLFRPKT